MKRLFLLPIFISGMILTPMVADSTVSSNKVATATFGGGCFWCMEAVFKNLPGIISITSGFAGGTTANPTYEQVCTGQTGHAETIQITYNPSTVSYEQLLDLFWRAHDPTTLNRQGADQGTQYRSIILTSSPEQMNAAEASKRKAQTQFPDQIVTEIKTLSSFYPAEAYHQDYYRQNKDKNPYCQVVIAPKLKKLGLPQ